jgi:hypothetical protein
MGKTGRPKQRAEREGCIPSFRSLFWPSRPSRLSRPSLLRKPLRLPTLRRRLSWISLTRGQIVPLVVGAHDRVLGIRNAPLELPDSLPDGRPDLWQPLGAKEEQYHQQDDHDLGKAQVPHRDLLEKRTRDQVRQHHSNQAQEGDVQPYRTQSEGYHQEIG